MKFTEAKKIKKIVLNAESSIHYTQKMIKKKRKRSKEKIVQRSEVKRRNRCGMTSD